MIQGCIANARVGQGLVVVVVLGGSSADGGDRTLALPLLPSSAPPQAHREHISAPAPDTLVLVARAVQNDEIRRTPAAQQTAQAEWDKLKAIECWDRSTVRECDNAHQETLADKKIRSLWHFLPAVS